MGISRVSRHFPWPGTNVRCRSYIKNRSIINVNYSVATDNRFTLIHNSTQTFASFYTTSHIEGERLQG